MNNVTKGYQIQYRDSIFETKKVGYWIYRNDSKVGFFTK